MKNLMLKLLMAFATLTISGCLTGGAIFEKKEGVSIKPKGFRVLAYDGQFESSDPYGLFAEAAKEEWQRKFKKAISIRMPEKLAQHGIPSVVESTSALSMSEAVAALGQKFEGGIAIGITC